MPFPGQLGGNSLGDLASPLSLVQPIASGNYRQLCVGLTPDLSMGLDTRPCHLMEAHMGSERKRQEGGALVATLAESHYHSHTAPLNANKERLEEAIEKHKWSMA